MAQCGNQTTRPRVAAAADALMPLVASSALQDEVLRSELLAALASVADKLGAARAAELANIAAALLATSTDPTVRANALAAYAIVASSFALGACL